MAITITSELWSYGPAKPIAGADPRFTIRRQLVGHAYPQNGNVHNPTPRYRWHLFIDGTNRVGTGSREREMKEWARECGREIISEFDSKGNCNDV